MSEPEPCPLGTYGNDTGLRKISDCVKCDPGSYCDQRGLTNPAGLCDPGYFCLEGSYTSAPNAPGSPLSIEDTDIGGLCPGKSRFRVRVHGSVQVNRVTSKQSAYRIDGDASVSLQITLQLKARACIRHGDRDKAGAGGVPMVTFYVFHELQQLHPSAQNQEFL